MADELKASPVKREWALKLANALRTGREYANQLDIPYLGGAGDVFLGKAPEGFERVAYDEPLTSGAGWTTRLRPETVDMGFLIADAAPAGKTLVNALRKGTEAASTSALRKITGNAAATPSRVIDEIQQMNLLPSATVWHGSPRTFDKFDLDLAKANNVRSARGEGLYLSESPDFAGKFRGSGSFGLEPGETQGIANILVNKGSKGEEFARKVYAGLPDIDEKIAAARKSIDETSSLYKVDLPDEQIAKMLDYDLPLADQSEYVKQALMKVNDPYINEALSSKPVFNEAGDYWSYMGNTYGSKGEALQDVTPAQLVSGQAGNFKSPQELSQRLYEAGIPGSHYAERDTRNYVVFSDEIPQILERNNQPVGMFK